MHQTMLELNYLVPTVMSDGNGIFISSEGDIPTLTFFQLRKQVNDHAHADVVASVRLNSLEDLQSLQNTIAETIKNHEQRER